jgi:hypothetical protein
VPDDTNILRVGAEFDVAPIITGTAQAGAAFDGLGAKIAATGEQAAVSMVPTAGLRAEHIRLAQATVANSKAQADLRAATAAAKESLDPESESVRQLAVAQLQAAAAAREFAAAQRAAGEGFVDFRGAMGPARVEMGLLEGSTGMMAGGLARAASTSAMLGPIMQAAFVPFAIIAVAAILGTVVENLKKASDQATGFTEAVQKAEKADVEFSNKALMQAHSVEDAYGDLIDANKRLAAAEGETFSEKYDTAAKEHGSNLLNLLGPVGMLINLYERLAHAEGDAADEEVRMAAVAREQIINIAAQTADQLKEQIDLTKARASATEAAAGSETAKIREQISALDEEEKLQVQLARAQEGMRAQREGGAADFAGAALRVQEQYAAKRLELSNQLASADFKLAVDTERAKVEAIKTIDESQVAFDEEVTKRDYAEHKISLTQETQDLVSEENKRIEILRASFAAQQGILQQRAGRGENVEPEMQNLRAQSEAAEVKHRQTLFEITAEGNDQQFKLDQEAALYHIEVDRQIAQADDDLATHRAEMAFSKAQTPEAVQAGAADYTAARTKAIEDQIASIKAENEVLAKDPSQQAAERVAENTAKIIALHSQEQIAILDINAETQSRTESMNNQQLSDAMSMNQERIHSAEDAEKAITDQARDAFEAREISSAQYVATVKSAAEQEYNAVAEETRREMDLVRDAANQHLITVEQETARLKDLWKQQEDAARQMYRTEQEAAATATKQQEQDIKQLSQQWSMDWTRMSNEVLQHRVKIGAALTELAGQMELQMIDKGIQLVVQKTATLLLELLASHASFLAQLLGIQTAGSATSLAKSAATSAAEIQQQAGVAGAEAYASALYSAPFPANLAIAAAAMASAIGTVEGNMGFIGAFEKGGVIPRTGFALMHEGEGVLTAAQMMTVNNNTSNRTTGPRRTNVEVNFNGGSGSLSHQDIIESVKKGIRSGELKVLA